MQRHCTSEQISMATQTAAVSIKKTCKALSFRIHQQVGTVETAREERDQA